MITMRQKKINVGDTMEKTIFYHKLVFHIPQKTWIEGELLDIYGLEKAEEKLFAMLYEGGVTSFYLTEATGYYNGRHYPETLLTVFGDTLSVSKVFEHWCEAHQSILRQEAYAYELDGKLIVFRC